MARFLTTVECVPLQWFWLRLPVGGYSQEIADFAINGLADGLQRAECGWVADLRLHTRHFSPTRPMSIAKHDGSGVINGRACEMEGATVIRNVQLNAVLKAMLAVTALLAVASCGPSRLSKELESATLSVPDSTSLVQPSDLRVEPLDVLDIKVFGVDSLNGIYQVDPSGRIRMPLIGVIDAKGMTIFELASELEAKLGKSYLQNPQVTVRIGETFGQQLTVEGSVAKPGMYPVRSSMTLLQAIAVSGGTTELANPRRVVVFRTIDGERRAAGFDLVKIRTNEAADPIVFGNDIIVVDGSDAKSRYRDFLNSVPLLGLFVGGAF